MIYALIALSAAVLITVIILMSNPLRWSNEHIRANMLKLTPIGTSMEDVIKVIESNEKWKIRSIRDNGYLLVGNIPAFPSSFYEHKHPIIGVKSIRAYLGEYRMIFAVGVSVFYGFDEDSKLIDIAVLKEGDSL